LFVADGLALVAKTGVGVPGGWLETLIEWMGYERRPLVLPLGNAAFLKAMSADYEKYVELRSIEIETKADGIYVIDTAKHIYLTPKKEVEHVFRIPLSQLNVEEEIDLRIEFPEGFRREKIKTNRLYSNTFDQNVIKKMGDASSEDGKEQNGASPASLLWGEYIFAMQSSSDKNIPYTIITAKYKCKSAKFDTDNSVTDTLYFPLGVPTEKVVVTVKDPEGEFIQDVQLNFAAEESRIFEVFGPIRRGIFHPDRKTREWVLTHHHPPLAAEMQLRIDVRTEERAEADGENRFSLIQADVPKPVS